MTISSAAGGDSEVSSAVITELISRVSGETGPGIILITPACHGYHRRSAETVVNCCSLSHDLLLTSNVRRSNDLSLKNSP